MSTFAHPPQTSIFNEIDKPDYTMWGWDYSRYDKLLKHMTDLLLWVIGQPTENPNKELNRMYPNLILVMEIFHNELTSLGDVSNFPSIVKSKEILDELKNPESAYNKSKGVYEITFERRNKIMLLHYYLLHSKASVGISAKPVKISNKPFMETVKMKIKAKVSS